MKLTREQNRQLHRALLSAFPSRGELERFLMFYFEFELDALVDDRIGLADTMYTLVKKWAAPEGRITELIRSVREEKPGNESMRELAVALGLESAPPTTAGALGLQDIASLDGCMLIDAQAIAEAQAEVAAGMDSMYAHLGRVALRHIVANQDVPRDLGKQLLEAISRVKDTPVMRFQLIRAKGGNGKSTLLLRLGYELASRGEIVVLARGCSLSYDLLRRACEAIRHHSSVPNRRLYLLLDNAYTNHISLLEHLDQRTIPNLTILATSRLGEAAPDAPCPGLPILSSSLSSDLGDLGYQEALVLIERIKSCGALRAENPFAVTMSAFAEQEPLLVAVVRLTLNDDLENYVQRRLIEMNNGRDLAGMSQAEWTLFLRIYYVIAVCHAWGVETPEATLARLTGLERQQVSTLLCYPGSNKETASAREHLRGVCGGTWRTNHELIAAAAVHYLADPDQTGLERLTWLLNRLAPADGTPSSAAAALGAVLFRRCVDIPYLHLASRNEPSDPERRAARIPGFHITQEIIAPARRALAVALDTPELAHAVERLREAATAVDLITNYAQAYLLLGRWHDARVAVDMALKRGSLTPSEEAEAYWRRGISLEQEKRLEEAIEDYTRALQLRPDNPDVYCSRGNAYAALGRDDEALLDYTQALTLRTDDSTVLGNRGFTYIRLGKNKEALSDLIKALSLQPDHANNLSIRGGIYCALDRFEEALADYHRSLVLRPNHPATWNNQGVAYYVIGKYEEALSSFDEALLLCADEPDILNNRGITYYALGRYDEALKVFTRALMVRPDHPDTLINRGNTFTALEDHEKALADYTRALELRPNHPNIPTTPVIINVSTSACGQQGKTSLTLSGSRTVTSLIQVFAEKYKMQHPVIAINIQGGGSTAGIQAVRDGVTDIGMSSRLLRGEEKDLIARVFANDEVAVIVNSSNQLENISLEQLQKVFAGEIQDWAELGQPPHKITLIDKETSSGTRAVFMEVVMKDKKIASHALIMNGTIAAREAVENDPFAIGYISAAALEPGVKALKIDGSIPDITQVRAGNYNIVQPFVLVTKEEPTGLTKDFIDFVAGPSGHDILAQYRVTPVI